MDGSPTVVSTQSPSPLSNMSPSSALLVPKSTSTSSVVQSKEDLDPLPIPPPLILAPASDPFDTTTPATDDDNGWGHLDFFKDNSFASLPGNIRGDDLFGFPSKSTSDSAAGNITLNELTMNTESVAFFDLAVNGADSWGEPSAILPDDFTPRKNATVAQHSKENSENCDALSYDASEMSEVTNPTYASATVMQNALTSTKPDPDGGAARRKGEHVKKVGVADKTQQHLHEPSESVTPLLDGGTSNKSDSSIDGKENRQRGGKHYSGGGGENAPASLASSGTALSGTDKLGVVDDSICFDDDQGTMTNIPRVAKSRIMAKYAKSGKVRRANSESLGTIHSSPMGNNKNEPQSPPRSIGTTSSSSAISRTGNQQKEVKVSSAKKSTSRSVAEPPLRPVAEPPLRRKGENVSAPVKSSAAVQSLQNPSNNAQLQRNTLQQGINPATTSTLAYRRGRKSPMKQLTSVTSGNIRPTKLIEVRGSPKRSPTEKYGANYRKKKVSPSVVDNPAYYSVRETRFKNVFFYSPSSVDPFLSALLNISHSPDGFSFGSNQGSHPTRGRTASVGGSHSHSDASTSIFGSSGCNKKDVFCINNTSCKTEYHITSVFL